MFAAAYIPKFQLQAALRYEPALRGAAAAIVQENEKPGRVAQFTRAAQRAGVRAGMTTSQAVARCPGLEVRYRAAEREGMAAAALLQCAAGFSPWIEATGEGICTLDFKGMPPGAYRQGAEGLLERLRGQELVAKIGIAATPGLALLAARNARPILHVTQPGQLRGLPISALAALDAGAGLLDTLRRLGIRSVGEFCELPPEGMAARFGEEGLECWNCVMGKSTRLLELAAAPQSFEEGMEFEQEIELLEPLLFMLRRFLDCITQRLDAAYLAAAALEMRIGFSAGDDYTRVFEIPSPTRNAETLFRMLYTHLENFQSPHPIKSLHLEARPCRAAREQLGLFETSLRDPNRFHETLARLAALVGADRAGVPVKENSFRPDAFHLEPPAFHAAGAPRRDGPRGLALRRFRPPRRAHVFTADRRPVALAIENFSAPLGRMLGAVDELGGMVGPPGVGARRMGGGGGGQAGVPGVSGGG